MKWARSASKSEFCRVMWCSFGSSYESGRSAHGQAEIAKAEVFGFNERLESFGSTLAPKARGFHAAEGNRRARELDAVHRDHGEIEPAHELEDRIDARGADIGREAVSRVIRFLHHFVER